MYMSVVSVSSRSYILSYSNNESNFHLENDAFPSPLGVIFSLILGIDDCVRLLTNNKFPSPLGVIFSLIKIISSSFNLYSSVGFRLLSELYSLLFNKSFNYIIRIVTIVSVSSRSYILSYWKIWILLQKVMT